jgi:hypothetical protein
MTNKLEHTCRIDCRSVPVFLSGLDLSFVGVTQNHSNNLLSNPSLIPSLIILAKCKNFLSLPSKELEKDPFPFFP